jgi:hypothetical protein
MWKIPLLKGSGGEQKETLLKNCATCEFGPTIVFHQRKGLFAPSKCLQKADHYINFDKNTL